jgi:hypothetical protein
MNNTLIGNREDAMTPTNVSVLPAGRSKPAARLPGTTGLHLLLRVVPSGNEWRWRLFSRANASRVPRLVYPDSKTYRTAEEAAGAGRAAIATAVARCTVSGPDGGPRIRFARSETSSRPKAS